METQKQMIINDLQSAEIFAGLGDGDIEEIAKICKRRTYRGGEYCSTQGENSDELQIVSGGKVAIDMRIEAAPFIQTIRIATLTSGSILDFSIFLEPHTPTTSAVCLEKVETIYIKSASLEKIFRERPTIENRVMKNLVIIMGSRFRDSRIQLARFVAEIVKQE